jgi:hypothetical protein
MSPWMNKPNSGTGSEKRSVARATCRDDDGRKSGVKYEADSRGISVRYWRVIGDQRKVVDVVQHGEELLRASMTQILRCP